MRTVISSLVIGFLVTDAGVAGAYGGDPACCQPAQDCCGGCGAKNVCKVVCEMKKVKKTVWAVECEEFCPSLPTCRRGCGRSCGDCEDACCSDPCASLRRPTTPPKCGRVRTRKKLVKQQVTCEVPVYRCVVVCGKGCCDDVYDGCTPQSPLAEPETPAAPAPVGLSIGVAPLPPVTSISQLRSRAIER